ncbi:hypothetical protein ABPG72_017278 [Tetrahymena utriculariae]
MSQVSSNNSQQQQQQQTTKIDSSQSKVSNDGQVKCVLCLKKYTLVSCKQCTRCCQISCKSCFKVDSKFVTPNQKKLFSSNNIGKCCFSDLIYQQNILSDTTIQWGKDSVSSINWCSNDYKQDYSIIDPKKEFDDSFEQCVEMSNTIYKDHLEMKLIEKDIFEDEIYSRKYMNKSFGEFLNTVQNDLSPDKVKQDQLILLKSFISYMLSSKKTPEYRIYLRGHGMLALFLLCFCSIKKSFYIMKEIYHFFYVDIIHPDQIKKEVNYCSIVKHVVFSYLENFQKKKDPTPQQIERIVAFTRKYLYFQYNFFFLNQLNLSSAFQIIELLLLNRTHEIMTRAMASIIYLNIKSIIEGDGDKFSLKDTIYNKIQPDNLHPLLFQQWEPLKKEGIQKILQDLGRTIEMEKYKLYDCGAEMLDRAVKNCIKQQKNRFKIMEEHYLKELKDLKNSLKLAMNELNSNAQKMHKQEVEKNNIIIQYQALKKKYEINKIEYEDIQSKLQFLNERANKRQMHYNKEYEEQVSNLQQQVKNQKLDFRELDMLYRNQQLQFKQQLEEKDNVIKRLKQGIQLLQRHRNEVVRDKANEQSLQEISEICNESQEQASISQDQQEDESINYKMFHSHVQTNQFRQPNENQYLQKSFERNNHILQNVPQLKQSISEVSAVSDKPDLRIQQKKSVEEQICDQIEDERQFFAVYGKSNTDLNKKTTKKEEKKENSHSNQGVANIPDKIEKYQSTNDQLSRSVLLMYKQFEDPQALQQAINEQQISPANHSYTKNIQFESTDEKQYISSLEHPYFENHKEETDYYYNSNKQVRSSSNSPKSYPEVLPFSPSQQLQQLQEQQTQQSPSKFTEAKINQKQGLKSASPHSHIQQEHSPENELTHNHFIPVNEKFNAYNNLFGNRSAQQNSNNRQKIDDQNKNKVIKHQKAMTQSQIQQAIEKKEEDVSNQEIIQKCPHNKRTLSNQIPQQSEIKQN